MNLNQILEESEKEFDEKFPKQKSANIELEEWLWAEKQDIKSFLRSHIQEAYKAGLDRASEILESDQDNIKKELTNHATRNITNI